MFDNLDLKGLQQEAKSRNMETRGRNAAQLRKELEAFEQEQAVGQAPQPSTVPAPPPQAAAPAKKGNKWIWAAVGCMSILLLCAALTIGAYGVGQLVVNFLDKDELAAQAPVPTPEMAAPTPVPAQPTAIPTPVLQPIPGERDPNACINKLYTYPANTEGILYDFEVQSGVVQMNDFYTPGNPTIIVLERSILPQERSAYALGWGSAWGLFSDRVGCEDFDMVTDAIRYAEARLDQGHAGLVIDMRDGTPTVVAMLEGMSQEYTEILWQMYRAARRDGSLPDLSLAAAMTFLTPPPEAMSAAAGCHAERLPDFGPNQLIGPYDHWVNLQPWWGDATKSPDTDYGQVNYLLPPGETVQWDLKVTDIKGGAVWAYESPACTYDAVVADLVWSGLPVYHTENGVWVEGPPPQPVQ
jgi:hypothetical protein